MNHPALEPISQHPEALKPLGSHGPVPEGLSATGLHVGYQPGRAVLHGINAAPVPGRLTALLGPNGCGKSTLLKTLLGQLAPWEGRVTLDGQPVASMNRLELARRVSYVPQRGESGFAFSVRQMVAMGRFAFGDEAHVDEALECCGLADMAGRSIHTLSGGQQQRVMVARAWAQSRPPRKSPRPRPRKAQPTPTLSRSGRSVWYRPEKIEASRSDAENDSKTFRGRGRGRRVVLADEPASSLDLHHAEAVMRLLRGMATEGMAVVVVLHGLDLALRWADDIWLMDQGRLVAQGTPDVVLTPAVLGPVYDVQLGEARGDTGQRLLYVRQEPHT